ncbi:tyrosine--tRNA ligase [Blattabacterium sp. (Cryptocercus punctulatus) str. Cpu]|uniref:tyrosine--tRNA ligase n=1 Tax=Blattabacterium sp. (Cryptocercus punctulatus) str. Cpu TaxID=1075399 RepID=UPI000238722F|nr:tyrosine--tRNA ligase [Blattabacterium sp. (Cryptocercus punctulatus) str. Cpu]AEU09130.1 tyrosine-tRNA ligase [Blattabacterium sp. (Cryptocercus punctulatus) str. Cpu]
MKNIIDELTWRGLIKNSVPGVEKQLKKITTIYIGFDPTYDSLHIGSLIPIIILIHFQRMGHKSLILIGGATGFIGDPSGKYDQRIFLKKKTLQENIESIKKQLSKLLDSYSEKIEFINNFDWIKNISFLEFIRNIGKHFTINYMISKDSVKNRIKNNNKKYKGISFMEFTYTLIQGYDFFYLNKKKNCFLQVGGSDQWGNITTGIELIKKKTGKKAYGITFPLVTRTDGLKFGKSMQEGNIWLDHNKTSPYKFYQFWINISDIEIENFIKIYTFFSKKKIETLILKHRKNPEKRLLQKKLASEITKWVHGKKSYEKVVKISHILFGKKYTNNLFSSLDEDILSSLYDNIPHMLLSYKDFRKGIFLLDLLKKSNLFKSKSEANRALNLNSISINKKIIKKNILLKKENIIKKKYILLQFGKKFFFIIKIE